MPPLRHHEEWHEQLQRQRAALLRAPINYVGSVRRAGTTPSIDENAFYAGQVNVQSIIDSLITSGSMSVNPQFLLPSSFQDPRAIRLGAKFTF